MNNPDQLSLALQTACLIQQNQMLKQQNAMLRDLMDHVDAEVTGCGAWIAASPLRRSIRPGRASGQPRSAVWPASSLPLASAQVRRHDPERWGLQPLSIRMSQGAHTPIHRRSGKATACPSHSVLRMLTQHSMRNVYVYLSNQPL